MKKSVLKWILKYGVLLVVDILIFVILYILAAIGGNNKVGMFSYADLYMIFVLPAYAVSHGIFTRVLLKQTLLPNILLIIVTSIMFGMPFWIIFMTGISLIFSLITWGISALIVLSKNHDKKKTENDKATDASTKQKCLKLCAYFVITIFVYLALFLLDEFVLMFGFGNEIFDAVFVLLTVFGYFPAVFVVYGIKSYNLTKKILLPNVLFVLACGLFVTLFAGVGTALESWHGTKTVYDGMKTIGTFSLYSIVGNSAMPLVVSSFAKIINTEKNPESINTQALNDDENADI